MRRGGRPNHKTLLYSLPVRGPRPTVSRVGVDGTISIAAPSKIGVHFSKTVLWTGKLLRQQTYTWADWVSLSGEARWMTFMDFFIRPGKTPSPVGGGDVSTLDELLRASCPTLAAYLGLDHWPDGECRQRSTLVIFWEEGMYKVCLSDKDTAMTLWASAKGLDDLPIALESRLTDPAPDWRKQRKWKK